MTGPLERAESSCFGARARILSPTCMSGFAHLRPSNLIIIIFRRRGQDAACIVEI